MPTDTNKPAKRYGKHFNALPGFGITVGFTLFYLSVIVMIPLGGQIEAINGALATVATGFGAALDDLAEVNAALGGLVIALSSVDYVGIVGALLELMALVALLLTVRLGEQRPATDVAMADRT